MKLTPAVQREAVAHLEPMGSTSSGRAVSQTPIGRHALPVAAWRRCRGSGEAAPVGAAASRFGYQRLHILLRREA